MSSNIVGRKRSADSVVATRRRKQRLLETSEQKTARQTADRERVQRQRSAETDEQRIERCADRRRRRYGLTAVLDIDNLSDVSVTKHICGSLALKCRQFYVDERLSLTQLCQSLKYWTPVRLTVNSTVRNWTTAGSQGCAVRD